MKVTDEIEVGVSIRVGLKDGELIADISVAVPYGKRTSTYSEPLPASDELAKVTELLATIQDAALKTALPKAKLLAFKSAQAAIDRGEAI